MISTVFQLDNGTFITDEQMKEELILAFSSDNLSSNEKEKYKHKITGMSDDELIDEFAYVFDVVVLNAFRKGY